MSSNQIAMQAIFVKAATTIDGGWRLTFDVDQSQAQQVMDIADMRDKGIYLVVMDQSNLDQK